MVLDDDGNPIRGAGAMPYGGSSGGVGDMSHMSFSRNLLEKPPSPDAKEKSNKFMANFAKMIEQVRAAPTAPPSPETPSGVTPELPPPVYPPGTTDEMRAIYGGTGETPEMKHARRQLANQVVRERIAAARKEAQALGITVDELYKRKRRENMAKARAARQQPQTAQTEGGEANGGTVAVPQPEMSEPGAGAPAAGQTGVQGDDERHGVSTNGVSDLSRSGSDGSTSVSAPSPQGQVPAESVQSQLTPAQQELLRSSVIIAQQPFHINTQFFKQMPLEQAEHLVNELRSQIAALQQMVTDRRQGEATDDLTRCMWCQTPYQSHPFAYHPFEIPLGSGQWHPVHSCRNSRCLDRFNAAVEKVQQELREERAR